MLNSKASLLFLGVLLCGCGDYKPEKLPEPNAMKEGPGLFSGQDGSFVLYQSDNQNECECPAQDKESN